MLRKAIAIVTWLFVAAMVVNTAIALRYRWPAMFDAPGNPDTIGTDFILHGTMISPPVTALLILSLASLFVLHRGWPGIVAAILLVAFSLLGVIAAGGEPQGLPANDVPAFAWHILGAIGRFAPLIIILMGLAELVKRAVEWRHERKTRSRLADR